MATGIGIDIGASTIKAVRVEKRGAEFTVTGAVKITVAEVPDEDYNIEPAEAIQLSQALAQSGIKARKTAVGISGKDLIIRYVEVPPVPPWRLKMIMDFEIGEMAARAGGDVTSSYKLLDLPPNKSGNNIVLVALAKNPFLEKRLSVLSRSGIGTQDLSPSSLGLFNAFRLQGAPPPGETTLIVDIGARNTEMVIQKDGVLLFARNVSSGGNLFTQGVSEALRVPFPEAERMKCKDGTVARAGAVKATNQSAEMMYESLTGTCGQFAALIRSSVMFCKSQAKIESLNLDRILLSGGGSRLKGLKENLQSSFKIPVEIFQPFASTTVVVDDPEQAEKITESPRELSIALGLAAGCILDPAGLKLLPERYQKRREFFEKKIFLFGAGAAALGFLAVGMFAGSHNSAVAKGYRKQVNRHLEGARKVQDGINENKAGMERTKKAAALVEAEVSSPARFLKVLGWIQRNMPDEIWIRQVELRRNTESTITRGDARVSVRGVVEKNVASPADVLASFVRRLGEALPRDIAGVTYSQPKEREGALEFGFEVVLMPLPDKPEKGDSEDEEDGGTGKDPVRRF